MVTPFVRGLSASRCAAGGRELRFAPQLPADWDRVSVVNIAAGESRYDLQLERGGSRLTITVSRDRLAEARHHLPCASLLLPPFRSMRSFGGDG